MSSINIEAYLSKKRKLIDRGLKKLFSKKKYPPDLYQASLYAATLPGKRIRPILLLATVESFGKNHKNALLPAIAIELVHTYSLIHDDLPCMDDSELRRGLPALHKAFPEWLALLTGDLFLTLAFEIISSLFPSLSPQKCLALVSTLAQYAGSKGLVIGQAIDMSPKTKDWKTIKTMHCHKTAKLFAASVKMGGIIAGVSSKKIKHLESFGLNLGLAFQITDDILDETSSKQKLGKPVGNDEKQTKTTASSLLGMEKAKQLAADYYEKALAELNKIDTTLSLLKNIAKKLTKRDC